MQSQQNTTFHTTLKHQLIKLFPELEPIHFSNKNLEELANCIKETKLSLVSDNKKDKLEVNVTEAKVK